MSPISPAGTVGGFLQFNSPDSDSILSTGTSPDLPPMSMIQNTKLSKDYWKHDPDGVGPSHQTSPKKLESKIFHNHRRVIHQKKRIASGFPGVCDFKSVSRAPFLDQRSIRLCLVTLALHCTLLVANFVCNLSKLIRGYRDSLGVPTQHFLSDP